MHSPAAGLVFIGIILVIVGVNFILFRDYVAKGRRPLASRSWQTTTPFAVPVGIGIAAMSLGVLGVVVGLILATR